MSETAPEVVRAFFATQREDILQRGLHPDIEWHVRKDFPDAGVSRGLEEFREFVARFDETFAEQYYEPLEFIEAGADVVVPIRWTAHGRASGAGFIEQFETWVFTVDDGLIKTVVEFPTKEEALQALGLRD
jgi:ketosteroid isomerase-like protein